MMTMAIAHQYLNNNSPPKKPLLERGTAQFTAVINAINKGQVESIDMVKIKYDLLEPIEDELTALIKKVKA
jgi:hypothetical protein